MKSEYDIHAKLAVTNQFTIKAKIKEVQQYIPKMEEILKELEEYAYYDLTQEQQDKLQGDPTLGGKIEIKWKGREYTDIGYTFQIPECDEDPDMQDYIIHIAKPDNSDGMDDAPPVWVHLNNLLSNKRVKWIKCN